jgi:hypothetical protein
MRGRHAGRTVGAEVRKMIGILGAILLLPLALVGLAYGVVRFAASLVTAVADAAVSRMLAPR